MCVCACDKKAHMLLICAKDVQRDEVVGLAPKEYNLWSPGQEMEAAPPQEGDGREISANANIHEDVFHI